MPLEPLSQNQLADAVERQILRYIREQGYRPGEPLPRETDLAEQLGVSRNVVREALSRLRMIGLVESRKRRGMVLGRPDLFRGLARVIDAAAFSKEDAAALAELRLATEMGIADLVYARRTPDLLKRLEACVLADEEAVDFDAHIAADIAFHQELFRATCNPLLEQLQGLLEPFFRERRRSIEAAGIQPRYKGTHPHRLLLDALRDGTSDDFRNALHRHLSVQLQAMGITKGDAT